MILVDFFAKLQQTSAETKRKTKFFIFGYAECNRNLSKVTTNVCRNKMKNFSFLVMPSAVVTYLKLQQTSVAVTLQKLL